MVEKRIEDVVSRPLRDENQGQREGGVHFVEAELPRQ